MVYALRERSYGEGMKRKPLTDIIAYLIYCYLIFMMTAVPLYMKDGYDGIGEAKYRLYTAGTIIFVVMAGTIILISVSKSYITGNAVRSGKTSLCDVMMVLFTLLAVISYIISPVTGKSLTGEAGWHMGLLTQLLMSAVYFIISFGGAALEEHKKLIRSAFIISGAVMTIISVIIIMNRFGFVLPGTEGCESSFISTIGNNDWYVGFWSVTSPFVIIACVIGADNEKMTGKMILYAEVFASFLSAFLQGSESVLLSLAAVLVFLLLISADRSEYAKETVTVLYIALGAAAAVRLLAFLLPLKLNYYGTVTVFLSRTMIATDAFIIVTVIMTAAYLIFHIRANETAGRVLGRYGIYIAALMCSAAVICAVLIAVNTMTGGIRPVAGRSFFTFDDDWGNSRGFIWKNSWEAFCNGTPVRKMFGSGPDGFAGYMYGRCDTAQRLYERFGNARLTNAHNTFITMLIDNGIIGTSVFILFILSLIRDCCSSRRSSKVIYICIASVTGYISCNMAGFQNVLNTPYAYIVMGIMSCAIRCTGTERKVS